MRAALLNGTLRNLSRSDLALLFLSLEPPPPGSPLLADPGPGPGGLPVADMERCFVCCCPLAPSLAPRRNAACLRRAAPGFCAGGPLDGRRCALGGDECGGGGRCADTGTVECAETDAGLDCADLAGAPNFTTAVNFTEPAGRRRLEVPDASGVLVTTGNLEAITALGVQVPGPNPPARGREGGRAR